MKRIIFLFLILCSFVLLFTACSESDELNYTVWELSEDENTLSDGIDTYYRYGYLPRSVDIDGSYLQYKNQVSSDNYSHRIYKPNAESGIVYIENSALGITAYYREESDKKFIDRYVENDISKLRICDTQAYQSPSAEIGNDFSILLDNLSSSPVNIAVRDLKKYECYDIYYYDDMEILSRVHGAIYTYNDAYYYLNYDNLGDNYFTSYGDFAYGRGSVDIYPLSDEAIVALDEAITRLETVNKDYVTEKEILSEKPISDKEAMRSIATLVTVFGIIAPMPTLVIGVVMLLKRKYKDRTPHIIISASTVWIVSGIIILILSL